jgi:squalene synthase HpnC
MAATRAAGPAATGPPDALARADEVLPKAARENFPVASIVLPRAVRRHLLAVYGYARLVDDAGDLAPGDRTALLDWLEEDLDRAYRGEAQHPLLRRLTPLVRDLNVPREPFLRLIEANRRDQVVSRYRTFAELEAYCGLSANPVGRLVLHVLGAATPERVRRSDAVCTALQLAEHWQDVGEDFRAGRIYLPREDLERFGVGEEELAGPRPGAEFHALMAFEVGRARGLLAEGVPLVRSLAGRGRLAVAAYVGGGRAALDAVERSGYDVLSRAPRASKAARAAATLRVLREAR